MTVRNAAQAAALGAALLGLLIAGAAGAARAEEPATATATMAKPAKAFQLLDPADFEPTRVIPAPPVDGGDRQKAELAEVQRAYSQSDAGRKAQAQWDNDHEDPSLYAPTLGYHWDMTELPATAALLAVVQNEASVASGTAKKVFKRVRPWAQDKSLVACDAGESDNPPPSYPSGHATSAYALAGVIVNLVPDKAAAIQDRAYDYAYSREICADHYPSDTEASHVLGSLVASRLLADPRLTGRLEAARAELKAAGVTPH